MTKLCMAGVTGWTGRAIAAGILAAEDLELTGALARKAAGRDVGEALGLPAVGVTISSDIRTALQDAEVLIDYTHPEAVKAHTRAAIQRGISVVIGTSGLTAADYAEIDEEARAGGVGVLAAGNFSLTAALVQHFALIAARHIGHFEVIDYAKAAKPDAPSGTAREMAERLGDATEGIVLAATGSIQGETSPGQFEIDLHTNGSKKHGPLAAGKFKCRTTALPMDLLDPVLRRAIADARLSGQLSTELDGAWGALA